LSTFLLRALRNIHAAYGAELPENPHGYCVQAFESYVVSLLEMMLRRIVGAALTSKIKRLRNRFCKVSNAQPATRDVGARHPRKISQVL
jgi:hypothetical protein